MKYLVGSSAVVTRVALDSVTILFAVWELRLPSQRFCFIHKFITQFFCFKFLFAPVVGAV
jgi:hypothetical protein